MKIIGAIVMVGLLCGCIDGGCPSGQTNYYNKGCIDSVWLEKARSVDWELSSSTEIEKIYLSEENVTCFRSIQWTFSCVEGKK
jgi:hypothetical protein